MLLVSRRGKMKRLQKNLIFLVLLAVFGLTSVASAEKPYKVAFSPADLYLGHISLM
jgi:hypothetical protein